MNQNQDFRFLHYPLPPDVVRLRESGDLKGAIRLIDKALAENTRPEMAARLRDQGLSAREIAEELERLKARQRFYAVVETLKYLKMGGRISGAAAVVGGMLGITPILDIRDGVVQAAGKARGRKAAYQWMEKKIAAEPVDTSLPVSFGHADAPQIMAECEAYFQARIPGMEVLESSIGSVVGTHAGPGCAGISYFVKE